MGGPKRQDRREDGLTTHDGCCLFLWTTTPFLEAAHQIVRAWRFKPVATLVWCKPPGVAAVGGTFASNVEFVIYAKRGAPKMRGTVPTRWFTWPRSGRHSQKPAAFLDMVEQVSPGPYLELFARRQRLGWDTWGNEALEHVELA
jgi:N6-adenosine-specific RNA methylase IME4